MDSKGHVKKGLLTDESLVEAVDITVAMDNTACYRSEFVAQHGLSLYIKVMQNGKERHILLDSGASAENLLHNFSALNLSVHDLDVSFFSHCHYDHTGGLRGVLQARSTKLPILAHPDLFRKTFKFGDKVENIGLSAKATRADLEALGGEFILVKDPFEVFPGIVSSGEILRRTEHEGKGIGAYSLDPVNGTLVKDELLDDMSLILNLKGKGLLIITGCCHAGIINTIQHAKQVTGVSQVYGMVGGLHLKDASRKVIDETLQHLRAEGLQLIASGHCTGFDAMSRLAEMAGEDFVPFNVGKKVVID